MVASLEGLLDSIRQKLGLDNSGSAGVGGVKTSREVPIGAPLLIMREGMPEAVPAIVLSLSAYELQVELTSPVTAKEGARWVVRYFSDVSAWEFDSSVIRSENGAVALTHSQDIRRINLRRFVRVPTFAPARAAGFSFAPNAEEEVSFRPATLVEIAGPGLVIQAPIETVVGERVLVMLDFGPDRKFRGVAKVRRAFRDKHGNHMMAVEMIGLNPEEVAQLVRETNLAATAKAREEAQRAAAV